MKRGGRQIIFNIFYLYSVQGLNLILPILVLPYLIRTLSIEAFGKYSFVFAFSQFVMLFVDFGFNLSATKKIAENIDNPKVVKSVYWNVTLIKLLLSVVSLLFVFIFVLLVPKISQHLDGILYSYIMVLGTVFFPIWWFQGNNKMRELSIVSAVSKIVSYPLIFVFVRTKDDYNNAIVIQSMSYFLAGIFSIVYLYRNNREYFSDLEWFVSPSKYIDEMKDSLPIFISNSSISLYTNSLTIFLGVFSTEYNVGLFGAMEKIVRAICFGILSPINQVCFPIIAQLKKNDFVRARRVFQCVFLFTLGMMLMVYLGLWYFREDVMTYLFKGFKGVDPLLSIFLLIIFPISLGGVLGQLGLLALGGNREKREFSRIYTIVGGLSVPLSLASIYYFHLEGAIAVMILVEVVVFMLFLVKIIRADFIQNR